MTDTLTPSALAAGRFAIPAARENSTPLDLAMADAAMIDRILQQISDAADTARTATQSAILAAVAVFLTGRGNTGTMSRLYVALDATGSMDAEKIGKFLVNFLPVKFDITDRQFRVDRKRRKVDFDADDVVIWDRGAEYFNSVLSSLPLWYDWKPVVPKADKKLDIRKDIENLIKKLSDALDYATDAEGYREEFGRGYSNVSPRDEDTIRLLRERIEAFAAKLEV